MNWNEELFNYLTVEPKARERKNKNRAIGNMIAKKYGTVITKTEEVSPSGLFSHFELKLSRERMAELIGDCLTADRAWRKTLEESPHLRGSDYKEKDELELKKKQELGYNT